MHVVSLTYKYDKIKLSFSLALFFRLMGVYVVEKFYEPKVNMQEDVDLLRSDFIDVHLPTPFSDFDAEIYLFSNLDELEQIRRANSLKRIVVLDQSSLEVTDENISFIKHEETLPNHFSKLLYDILQSMHNQNLLDAQELDDCRKWAKIYGEENFSQTLYQVGYTKLNEEKLNLWKEQYYAIVNKIFERESIFSEDSDFWRQPQHKYVSYALLSTQYNINVYGVQQKQKQMFDPRELLRNAIEMERNVNDLKSAVRDLIGNIYYYLLDKKNKAYDYYMNSCIGNQEYNYSGFSAKGRYWQFFAGDYDKAKKYYYKSLLIYPDNYRGWYSLGYCFYRQGDTRNAVLAFYAIRKLLENRLHSRNIKPLEIRLYYSACKTCAWLLYNRFADLNKAIELYEEAEKAWSLAKETVFWEWLGKEADNARELLQKQLDILTVYNWLIKLYDMKGTADRVDQYKNKKQFELQRRKEHEKKVQY